MKIIEWIRPLREVSLAGKHVRLYMGNEAGDLDSGKNKLFHDSFMTHQLNNSFFYDLLYKGYSRTCIFDWTQKVSCERNNSVFISRLSLELNASRWVNIDLIFFNSLLCSGNVLLQPVCRS